MIGRDPLASEISQITYIYIHIHNTVQKFRVTFFHFFTILVAAWRLEWVRMLWISAVNIHLGLWSSWQKSLTLWPCNTCSFLTITDRIYESMTKIGCFCCDGETGEKQEKEKTYSRFQQDMTPICMHNLQMYSYTLLQAWLMGNSLITSYPPYTHTLSECGRPDQIFCCDLHWPVTLWHLWHAWASPRQLTRAWCWKPLTHNLIHISLLNFTYSYLNLDILLLLLYKTNYNDLRYTL